MARKKNRTDEEIHQQFGYVLKKLEIDKEMLRHTDCDCKNPEYHTYRKNERYLKRMRQIADAINIPHGYREMCFDTYETKSKLKKVSDFIEYKKFDYGGRQRYGLTLAGGAGIGKTHLAISIMHSMVVRHWQQAKYVDVSDLLMSLRDSYNQNQSSSGYSELGLIRAYQEIPIVLFDDISVETTSSWVREKIFQIINGRYSHNKITMITSNDNFDMLSNKLGERTVSRLMEMTAYIQMTGPDRRSQ